MATIEQLSAALVKADAAGNTDDARALANAIRAMKAEPKPEPSMMDSIKQGAGNLAAGAVRGAGSIGATILAPIDVAKDALAGKGLSLESNRQRRADIDAALQSLGADPESLLYKTGKIGGEIAGTAGAGGVVANAMTRVPGVATNFPTLINAIRTGGMTTGSKVAPGAVNALRDLAVRGAGGAISGAATAGLVNPDDAALGAVIGGSIPAVVKTAGAVGGAVSKPFRYFSAAVSDKSANKVALEKVSQALGDDAAQAAADIGIYYPKNAETIPVSAAAITKNPRLAELEQGSRLKGAPQWYEFDQKQAKAVFDNVLKATSEAEELGARAAARRENWSQAWAKATESQKPRIWAQRMTQFADDLDSAAISAESANPAVRGVVDAIRNEIDRVGPNFGIGHLQQIRANLSGRSNPISSDVFKAAPRDSAAVKSIIQEVDDILNSTTRGKWQKVIEGYAKDSESLHAAKAAQKIRGSFVDEIGRIRGVSADPAGDVAKITEAGLGRAMDAARMPDKTTALSGPAYDRLNATLDALRRQNIVQSMKRSATAGGGSDTVSNALAAGLATKTPNFLVQLLQGARQLGSQKTDAALASLLSNPDDLAAALSRTEEGNKLLRLLASPSAREIAYKSAPVFATH